MVCKSFQGPKINLTYLSTRIVHVMAMEHLKSNCISWVFVRILPLKKQMPRWVKIYHRRARTVVLSCGSERKKVHGIWPSPSLDTIYSESEFIKIKKFLMSPFWVIAILGFSPYTPIVDFKGLISKKGLETGVWGNFQIRVLFEYL